jgi:hypothetical protein
MSRIRTISACSLAIGRRSVLGTSFTRNIPSSSPTARSCVLLVPVHILSSAAPVLNAIAQIAVEQTAVWRACSCERSSKSQHWTEPSASPRKSTASRVGLHTAAVYFSLQNAAEERGLGDPTCQRWNDQSPTDKRMSGK